MRRHWLGWAVALGVLAGCGDSGSEPPTSSDREQIEAAMTGYLAAIADGDGDEACGHLAAGAQKDLTTLAGGSSCQESVQRMSKALDDKTRDKLRAGGVDRVVIDGTTAKATVEFGDTIPLEKAGGTWKVTEFASGGGYANQQQAQCVTGGMNQFDEGGGDPFWRARRPPGLRGLHRRGVPARRPPGAAPRQARRGAQAHRRERDPRDGRQRADPRPAVTAGARARRARARRRG